jgi:hypothetical protein
MGSSFFHRSQLQIARDDLKQLQEKFPGISPAKIRSIYLECLVETKRITDGLVRSRQNVPLRINVLNLTKGVANTQLLDIKRQLEEKPIAEPPRGLSAEPAF